MMPAASVSFPKSAGASIPVRSFRPLMRACEAMIRCMIELADISSEEYPKQYERVIAEYLKRLSYQE